MSLQNLQQVSVIYNYDGSISSELSSSVVPIIGKTWIYGIVKADADITLKIQQGIKNTSIDLIHDTSIIIAAGTSRTILEPISGSYIKIVMSGSANVQVLILARAFY